MDNAKNINEFVTKPSDLFEETHKTLRELVTTADFPVDVATEAQTQLTQVEKNLSSFIDDDFDVAHTNIKTLIVESMMALKTLLILANTSDHPRAYEVAGTFIQTIADLNKDLLELQEKRIVVKSKLSSKDKDEKTDTSVTNNNVFVGTPQDFLELMQKNRK